ncbi:unnamed protein product, partial [marine sediment metagenome]
MNKRFLGLVLLLMLATIVLPIQANADTEEVYQETIIKSVPNDAISDLVLEAISDNITQMDAWDNNYWAQYNVDVEGSIAFISCYGDGLLAVNVSDPANPYIVGQYQLGGNLYLEDVYVLDDIAYLACNTYGVVSLNVSDPTNMVMLDRYDTSGIAYDIVADGNFVFVAG